MPPSGFLTAPPLFTVSKLPCDCYAAQKADTAFLGAAKRLVRNSTRARCPVWFAAPQTAVDLLTFAPSKQYGPLELLLLVKK